MTLYFCGLPPPKPRNSSLIMSKTSYKSQLRDILQNTWPIILKTVKFIKKQEKLRNCHSQEEPKKS